MKYLFIGTILIVFSLVTAGCGSGTATIATTPVSETKTSGARPVEAAWQEQWGRTLAAGKTEGKVVVSTSFSPSVRQALTEAFGKKYGIDLEFLGGMSPDNVTKIIAERRAGLYTTDIALTGITSIRTFPEGTIEPLEPAFILPEVKDVNLWREKKLPFADPEGTLFMYLGRPGPTIAINKELVKPEELKSWRNLLDPKWKGKMLLHDPRYAGAGNAIVTTIAEIMGIDFLRELAKQDPIIMRDYRTMVEWVARGKNPFTVGFNVAIMEDLRKAGAPLLNVVPAEGTYFGAGIGALSSFSKAPHPNATSIFINWFLSKEGQTLLTAAADEQSTRIDVPPVLPLDRLYQEGVKYVDSESEYFTKKRTEIIDLSKEIFAATK